MVAPAVWLKTVWSGMLLNRVSGEVTKSVGLSEMAFKSVVELMMSIEFILFSSNSSSVRGGGGGGGPRQRCA